MKRIDVLNCISTALVLGIVTSITLCGYYSLERSAAVGRVVDRYHRQYQAYERIGDQLESEQYFLERYLTSPELGSRHAALLAQAQFDRATTTALEKAGAPERRVLVYLQSLQHQSRAAIHRVEELRVDGNLNGAVQAYGSGYLPVYEEMASLVQGAASSNLSIGRSVANALNESETALRWVMLGIGSLGLLVVAGLLCTVHAYKERASRAIRNEMKRLEDAARSDSLTLLGNHRAFYEDFGREIARSRRQGHALTVAVLDIDGFKELNDAGGHPKGDDILVRIARVLRAGRREDREYRIGGDEFALLLPDATASQAAVALDRLRLSLKSALEETTLSIGYCELNGECDEQELYERADAALYEAKRRGRNNAVNFATMRGAIATIGSSRKSAALRTLLETRAMKVAFQPIWDLSTKRIMGFEALARPDPSLGFTGPVEAFDAAERNHKVTALDCLCLETIISAATWLPPGKKLFLNMTPETIESISFKADMCDRALQAAGLKPSQIVIEVTERHIGHVEDLVPHLRALREFGVLLALGDTGSGSAGLELLAAFSFDFVKIDRGIMEQALTERRARGVIAGILAIARESGSYVIAEGIERIAQLEFVQQQSFSSRAPGISGAQGYLLGRPVMGVPDLNDSASYAAIVEPSLYELAS